MFKVGQLVWCTKRFQYSQTSYHVKCIVTGIIPPTRIVVRITEGRYKGNEWDVDPKFFEPVFKSAKIV